MINYADTRYPLQNYKVLFLRPWSPLFEISFYLNQYFQKKTLSTPFFEQFAPLQFLRYILQARNPFRAIQDILKKKLDVKIMIWKEDIPRWF